MLRRLLLALPFFLSLPALALELGLPIDCHVGEDCFIQNYVDRDPTSGASDYTCGHLTYDKHKGTDFRLLNLAQMQRGVNVLASAGGTVKALRNTMDEGIFSVTSKGAVAGRECGNGVLIITDDGFETQYCHMRKGSIVVVPGQRVTPGQVLGQVGLSGMTQFPHVHLEVRKAGTVIDPFVGVTEKQGCDSNFSGSLCAQHNRSLGCRHTLWRADVAPLLQYIPTGFLGGGFAGSVPTNEAIRAGLPVTASLPASAPVLIFWIDIFGVNVGDTLRLRILDPSGVPLGAHEDHFTQSKAQFTGFIGKKHTGNWAPGTYTGEAVLERAGKEALRLERRVRVD